MLLHDSVTNHAERNYTLIRRQDDHWNPSVYCTPLVTQWLLKNVFKIFQNCWILVEMLSFLNKQIQWKKKCWKNGTYWDSFFCVTRDCGSVKGSVLPAPFNVLPYTPCFSLACLLLLFSNFHCSLFISLYILPAPFEFYFCSLMVLSAPYSILQFQLLSVAIFWRKDKN